MEIKNIENLYNLEDTVGLLVDKANFNFLGFNLKDQVASYDNLPATGEQGAVYAVGTAAPYTYYTYVNNEWLNLGVWPLKGPKGNPGDKGPQGPIGPVGAKGDKGDQGIAGPAGNGLGVDYITKLDLASGNPSIAYDKTSGAALSKSGVITAAGQEYDISVTDKLPIIPGDNIDIYTNGTNNALKIGAKVPVTSVNGQKGDVRLTIPTSTSQLVNDAEFITAEYHDNTKQNTLKSGENIKTINNQSILGSGNLEISGGGTAGVTSLNGKIGDITLVGGTNVTIEDSSGTLTINATGGGGGGTDTGFDNVREIQAADDQTTYNPDTKEYLISSGTARVFYKDNTSVDIPYVQEIGLMAGDNITFTEEFVDNANYRVKINATGGGSGGGTDKGFDNLSELTIAASQYASPHSAAGPFYFTGSGTASWKDGSVATSIPKIDIQLGCEPGAGISFKAKGEGAGASCEIELTDLAVLDLGEFSSFPVSNQELTVEQAELIEQHKFSFIKFGDPNGWNNGAGPLNVYCVPVDDALGHGGKTYKSITTQGNTYTVNVNIQRTTGNAFQSKTYSITKEATPTSGGGGSSTSLYQHTITIQGSQYKYKMTVVNSYQGSITGSSIWKEIYGTNKFTVPAIVTDSMDKTAAISSVYVGVIPTNGLSILFWPANQDKQNSDTISSSATWEDNIISL